MDAGEARAAAAPVDVPTPAAESSLRDSSVSISMDEHDLTTNPRKESLRLQVEVYLIRQSPVQQKVRWQIVFLIDRGRWLLQRPSCLTGPGRQNMLRQDDI